MAERASWIAALAACRSAAAGSADAARNFSSIAFLAAAALL
jgi:hypothetical protein